VNAARCACSALGTNPDCRIDHEGAAEDRAARAAEHMADPRWLSEECFDPLTADLGIWDLFIAEDDATFCACLRERLRPIAAAQSKQEVDEMGVSI
jgi:hypothetical protein